MIFRQRAWFFADSKRLAYSDQLNPESSLLGNGRTLKQAGRGNRTAKAYELTKFRFLNSLAIESQLANLATDSLTAVYLNDDFFLNEVSPLCLSNRKEPGLTCFSRLGDSLYRSPISNRLSLVPSFECNATFSSEASTRFTRRRIQSLNGSL